MAHKTMIDGVAYEIGGGKTLINGTGYSIDKGKTLVGGTAYEVGFREFIEVFDFGLLTTGAEPGSNTSMFPGMYAAYITSWITTTEDIEKCIACDTLIVDGVEYELTSNNSNILYYPDGKTAIFCLSLFGSITASIGFHTGGQHSAKLGHYK